MLVLKKKKEKAVRRGLVRSVCAPLVGKGDVGDRSFGQGVQIGNFHSDLSGE